MLTSERLLKIISILTVLITLGFSAVVVTTELMRPEKMFDRVVEDECGGDFFTDSKSTSESDLRASDKKCILIKEQKNSFQKLTGSLGKLGEHHYLFKGKEGVLLRQGSTDFQKQADYIHKCLRTGKCDLTELKDEKISVTGLMYDRSGKLVSSNTFFKTSLSQTASGFKRLFTEIAKINDKDISQLALKLLFHHSYTFIEKKDPSFINRLVNGDTDGLYISSRGAKIRILPFEHSSDAMKILNRKGRQYGLKKDEYKNDLAKIYLFRTSQYFENGQEMVSWEGNSSLKKKDYSDNIALMFLKKHLENALSAKKRFVLERNIGNGEKGDKYASFFTQLSLAEATAGLSPYSAAIINNMTNKKLSDLTASYLFNIINLSGIDSDTAGEFMTKTSKRFSDPELVKELIKKNPVYSGFFLETHLLSTNDSESTSRLFDTVVKEFVNLGKKDKVRSIIYLSKLELKKDSELYNKAYKFINSKSKLFKKALFDSRGFQITDGAISLSRSGKPDTALSLAVASGLSGLKKQSLLDRELLEIESRSGNFIKFLIVTGDDFPRWKDPKTKVRVQGGVRSQTGSDKIKLSNTIRAYNYFKNRSGSAR